MAIQWSYKPTDKEHEALLRALAERPEYPSVSQFVREAVIRMIHDDDHGKLFAELSGLIENLHELKETFMSLVLKASPVEREPEPAPWLRER